MSHNATIIWAVIGIIVLGLFIGMYRPNKQTTTSNVTTTDTMTTPTPSSDIKKPTGIILHTTSGDIEIAFFTDKAPKTVENFVTLSKNNFYNDTKFHRVIKGFMIQGGDPLSKGDDKTLYGRGGPGYAFADEFNDEKLVRGVLAMANSGPNTNGSQFFIVTAASTPWLDGKHTAFGKVVKGMDIVDRIENVRTGQNDIPETAIVVKSVEIR